MLEVRSRHKKICELANCANCANCADNANYATCAHYVTYTSYANCGGEGRHAMGRPWGEGATQRDEHFECESENKIKAM